jgi:Ca2+/Na+ antiporter
MHSQILPAADDLTSSGANTLDATYEAARGEITTARIWVLLLTAAVLALLVWLQLLLARRYRRLLNPSLIVSTLIVVAVTAGLDDLSGWTVIPAVTTLAVVALLVVGVRPRLREYA